jgi:hypothetical protein
MSKSVKDPVSRKSAPATRDAKTAPAPSFKPPFTPRPGIFYLLLGMVGVWVVILLTLYFVTVYPTRREHPLPSVSAESPQQPVESTVPR